MRQSIYLETSVISYYANRLTRNIIIAGRQKSTREWWRSRRSDFDIFISELVFDEISKGHPGYAKKRIAAVSQFKVLINDDDATSVARALLQGKAIPKEFVEDALHIGIAAVNGIDFILTWNFSHINNAQLRLKIERTVENCGYACPIICAPDELLGRTIL